MAHGMILITYDVQVNTKFLNTLPSEWSKFVTDVKLVRDLHTTNIDQRHAYLGQHEYHANEPLYHQSQSQQQATSYQSSPYAITYHNPQFVSQGSSSPNLSISYPVNDTSSTVNHSTYMASAPQIEYALIAYNPSEFSSPETRLVVLVFQKGDDPIDAIIHMMSFLTSVVASRQALDFQNPRYLKKAQQLKPNLYDGSVIGKSDVVVVPDSEDTLMHAEESQLKTIKKQNASQMIEKKVITKPIDYAALNQLSTYFNTRFVSQTESYAEQAFWSQYSVQTDEPNLSGTTIVEVPKELPKVIMVNSCLKKIKFHLASFDMVKERTTTTSITEGTWGFKHTKACFRDDIIPFVKNLKELFTSFDQCLIDEVTEVQNIFKQMELAVEQHCAEKNKFQTKMENVLKENDRLLTQALSVEIVQEKDTVILKLKEKLKSFSGDVKERKVEREVEEIETQNLELDHKVTKLSAENKHLKQT
nr:hypothetical protein [Tanacetum cinerariifolium]